MAKIELGRIGAVLNPGTGHEYLAAVREVEALGIATIWLTGGPLEDLDQIADVVRATQHARIASGILSVDRFAADAVAALYAELESEHRGRFVVGLGGAHGAQPLQTLTRYLDALTAVPRDVIVMAALGPRMLAFARAHAAGALPVLVTPTYTAWAREQLGGDMTLAVEQIVVLETDPARARAIARGPLGFLGTLPAYQASFRRMGFTDDEITQRADQLVDALVAWGDAEAIAARVAEHHEAGADHVAISVSSGSDAVPVAQWAQLVRALGD